MSKQFLVNRQDDNVVTFHVDNQLAEVICHQGQSFDALLHRCFSIHIVETVPSYRLVTVSGNLWDVLEK